MSNARRFIDRKAKINTLHNISQGINLRNSDIEQVNSKEVKVKVEIQIQKEGRAASPVYPPPEIFSPDLDPDHHILMVTDKSLPVTDNKNRQLLHLFTDVLNEILPHGSMKDEGDP